MIGFDDLNYFSLYCVKNEMPSFRLPQMNHTPALVHGIRGLILYKNVHFCHYRKSHCVDKTILRPFYFHNVISYPGNPTNTHRNKHVINTSKRSYDVLVTCLLRCVFAVKIASLYWIEAQAEIDCTTWWSAVQFISLCFIGNWFWLCKSNIPPSSPPRASYG